MAKRLHQQPTCEDASPSSPKDAREVKERIHEAALKLFAAKGFHAVSVRDICREANTMLPMVYYYFHSKRGLYDALLDEAVDRRVRGLQSAKVIKAMSSTGSGWSYRRGPRPTKPACHARCRRSTSEN